MTERAVPAGRDGGAAAVLWLAELQRVSVRGAHAIKNALNGVAVNLEVVRGRARQAGGSPDSLGRFASAAAEQLDRLTILCEALLAITRPPREPVDVRATAMALHALLRESQTGSAGLVNGTQYEGSASTAAPGDAVRLGLAHALLPAADDERPAEWCVEEGGAGASRTLVFRVQRPSSSEPRMAGGVEAAVRAAGIRVERGAGTLSLIFPGLTP